MEIPVLPYRAEYAKSGRAGCKKCKNPIHKDSIRLAVMVRSSFFDGMQPNWHHFSCFFERFKPKDITDISHFDSLHWSDQELIRKKLEKLHTGSAVPKSGKNSKSKKRNAEENQVSDLNDYTVEYAKSKRSKCKVCEEFINKDEVRISKKDYENDLALQYGPTERWHHIDCFIKAREELGFFASAKILPGFESLSEEDQKELMAKIPYMARNDTTDGPSPSKKPKEDEVSKSQLKKQNEKMLNYRDKLEILTKQELLTLLQYNNQEVPEGISRILDRLSDAMAFGALKKCEKCKGQLTFRTGFGYQCLGDISEWSKCRAIYTDPARVPLKIPAEMKKEYSFLKSYKGTVSKRLFIQSLSPDKMSSTSIGTTAQSKFALNSLKFFIHKTDAKSVEDLKKQVESLGGRVVKKWEEDIFAVISTEAEVKKSKLSKHIKAAKDSEIHVLPDTFFDDVTTSISKDLLVAKLSEKKISSWGADPINKIKETPAANKSVYPSKSGSSKSQIFKSNETVKKITLKGGIAVDPDSKLEKIAHVYCQGDEIFSVVLSLTDLQTGSNSYYKLQVLESDSKAKYYLFRAWGRIGTTIGGNKVEQYHNALDCVSAFEKLFMEKTGNAWASRNNFKKVAGKMAIVDIEYKNENVGDLETKPKLESKTLSKPVQDLITLIFDIRAWKTTMLEYELNLNKMPLGKLSQRQIQKAFGILSELQNCINSAAERSSFVEKTNMFYNLIPHDCGINVPPLIDNEEIIKQKVDLLNSLMDIEIAYKILQDCEKSDNSIDYYYKQLGAEITDLESNSDEFKIIELYVKNTHAATHGNYTLDIQNVFKIERKGEAKRYKKYSKLSNRKLLWHGSRLTNFAGILSQGLRIAPPEAPVTGYMFGKGIYFSDRVSKSANYCSTSKLNPTGLLLLCEVALGEMHELTHSENCSTKNLPPGKSSVKGVGRTEPDPAEKAISPSGAEVPLGKGVDANITDTSLLYNEYIVYNVAQVKIQYLLKVKFNYKI